MKVQCERCKEIVDIGAFRASERGIDITCVACGASYFVEASASAAPAPAPAPAPVPTAPAAPAHGEACPKCGEAQPPAAGACVRCGLAVARFAAFRFDAADGTPDELIALWDSCRDRWDDPAAHERFLQAAVAADAYRYAAARYRAVLRDEPTDHVARTRLDEVARRAEAALLQPARATKHMEDEREPYRNVAIVLVVLVALAAVASIYAMFRGGADAGVDAANPARVSPAQVERARRGR